MELTDKIGAVSSLLTNLTMEKYKKPSDSSSDDASDKSQKAKRANSNVKHYIYDDGQLVATSDNAKDERSRRFNLRSYIPASTLDRFLKTCPWVQYWAYCLHDKDVNEDGTLKKAHTHVLLYTYSAKTASAIEKNFDRLDAQTREEGALPDKTHVEIMRDTTGSWRYLRHLDDPDKYQYPEEARIANEKSWWFTYERTDGLNDASNNRALTMFDDRKNGMHPREFFEKYGRDGLMFLGRVDDAITKHRIETESAYAIPFDRQLLDLMLNASNFSRQDIAIFNTVLAYVQRSCKESYGSTLDFYFKEDIKNA